jgi:hypothetical protein
MAAGIGPRSVPAVTPNPCRLLQSFCSLLLSRLFFEAQCSIAANQTYLRSVGVKPNCWDKVIVLV